MSSIDERVVQMKFDNAQFERGVSQTIKSMDSLNKSLKMEGAAKGLNDVAHAAKGMSLAGIAAGVENISSKFTALGVIGVTALANIANKAINAGATLVKSLTIDPILSGFHEYETNLNSIQTILANTGLEGQKGLDKVNKALNDLNHYSDQTIYNFSEMARNIGTFTAAGVKLNTATQAIKGIANLAAVSGSSSEQASTAMYQLSQAIASGTVKLMDWNSVVNAGMGGKVFQEALKTTARNHGVAVDKIIKKEGSFRDSLKTGWLSSKILTETLNQFTGDMTAKQLKQLGYTEKQIKAIQKMGKMAKNAATQIKTFSGLIGALQEAVGSGWAQTWQTLVGDFGEAKTLFTGINNVVGGFIQSSSNARNAVLKDWKALGGRTAIINSIGNVFKALTAVIKPIHDAFRDIFPPTTGKQLADISKAIERFTSHLIIGGKTSEGLKNTFKGLFAIFDIAKQVIFGVVGGVLRLFNVFSTGNGTIFTFTGGIGTLIAKFDEWLKKTDVIGKAFDVLVNALTTVHTKMKPVYDFVGKIADAFQELASGGFDAFLASLEQGGIIFGKFADQAQDMYDRVVDIFQQLVDKAQAFGNPFEGLFGGGDDTGSGPLEQSINGVNIALASAATTGEHVKSVWQSIVDAFRAVGDFLAPIGAAIQNAFSSIKEKLMTFVQGLGIQDALAVVNTGFFIAFYMMLRKFLGSLTGLVNSAKGAFDNIGKLLGQVTKNLKTMQTSVRADIILKIAGSLALLAAAIYILSKTDPKQLGLALGAVAVMLGELVAALAALEKFTSFKGAAQMTVLASALLVLGVALLAMAGAVAIFGSMDFGTLMKGLGSIAVILAALVGASALLSKTGGGGQLLVVAASLLILSVALTALAGALKLYASIDVGTIVSGGLKAVAVVAGLALAMQLMGPGSLAGAAALFVVANALVILAGVLKLLGTISKGNLAKSLIGLAAALLIIGLAMAGMTEGIAGAAALLVFAYALTVLVPVLALLGSMDISTMVKALLFLAAALLVIGGMAAVLTPVVPVITALAGAIALLGLAMLAAGAGMFLFATGLATLAVSGAAGIAVLTAAIISIVELIPLIAQQIGLGLIAIAVVISNAGPKLVEAFVKIIGALIDAAIKLIPKGVQLFNRLIDAILEVLVRAVPRMVVAALAIVTGVLQGIAKGIPKVIQAGVDVIKAYMAGIAKAVPDLVTAGYRAVIDLINGVSDAIDANSAALGEAGGRLGVSIIKGMAGAIRAGIGEVAGAARDMAWSAVKAAAGAIDSHSPSKEFEKLGKYSVQGFAKGLSGNTDQIKAAYTTMKSALKSAMQESAEDIAQLHAKLDKLNKARHRDVAAIRKTKAALAQANAEHAKEAKAYKTLTKYLDDDETALYRYSKAYDKVAAKLKVAQDNLAAAKKTRDDYAKSIKDQYSDLPDISQEEKADQFVADLQKQLDAVIKYSIVLQELRKKGLNDTLYKELLAKGPEALAFAQDLLANGDIAQINSLEAQIQKASGSLGTTAAKELYQAGVNAAQGIVNGLISQEKALQKVMDRLAAYMVASLKKALGIKSPSKVFFALGEFTGEGLVNGLDSMKYAVNKSAESVGQEAILGMQKSITDMRDLLGDDMDMNPVITPVLDLTDVKAGFTQMGNMLTKQPISLKSGITAAKDASIGYQSNQTALKELQSVLAQPTSSVEYTQINNSPKALSSAEIYRQTNNQLSKTIGGLP